MRFTTTIKNVYVEKRKFGMEERIDDMGKIRKIFKIAMRKGIKPNDWDRWEEKGMIDQTIDEAIASIKKEILAKKDSQHHCNKMSLVICPMCERNAAIDEIATLFSEEKE